MKKILFVLIPIISFTACKGHKITKKCCDSPPIQENFTGGYLSMPNIFSPDGDGINDVLVIRHKGLKSFYLTIKNGIGKKIFETTDPDQFWGGSHKNKIDYGSYKYKLEVETINGEKINTEGRICVWGFNGCKSCNCIEDADKCVFGDRLDTSAILNPSSDQPDLKCN